MRGDSQPRLRIDILLAQIHILLRTRVYDINIHTLIPAGSYVGCDDDQRVYVRGIPYAFRWWIPHGLQSKFDGMGLPRVNRQDCKDEQ